MTRACNGSHAPFDADNLLGIATGKLVALYETRGYPVLSFRCGRHLPELDPNDYCRRDTSRKRPNRPYDPQRGSDE